MADITREIEITAALSSDYQAAFKSASNIARDTASELAKLSKRESDLAKMTEIAGKSAKASAAGDAKSVAALQKEYDKLARKLGLADKSAEGLSAELARVGAQRKQIEALNRSAAKSAELGRLARQIKDYTQASQRVNDPAIQAALVRTRQRFKELGGSIPDKKRASGFLGSLKEGAMQAPGPLGNLFRSVSSVGGGLLKAGGAATVAIGSIAAVAAAAVAASKAMWDFGKQTIEAADHIAKTSRQLGIASDSYQELAYAVGLGGASEQDFDTALRQLNKQMEAAIDGNSKAIKAFKGLGVSMADIKSMNTEEMFMHLSDSLSKVDDVAARTRTTMTLFGTSGTKVATAIAGGSEALSKMRKEAREAGYVLNGKSLKDAEEANDNFTRAQLQMQGVIRQLGVEAMPVMNEALQNFVTLLRDNKEDISFFVHLMGDVFTGSMWALANAVKGVHAGFKIFAEGIEYWQEKLAQFLGDIDRGIGVVKDSLIGLGMGIVERIKSIADFAVNYILEKINVLSEKFKDVPFLSQALDKAGSFVGGLSPTIVVNTSVDARGAAPGAGADVSRAVAAGADASGLALAELSYSGVSGRAR